MGRGQGLERLGHQAAPGDGTVLVRRRFGTKCAGCAQGISPSDLVRKARSKVFHLNCFTCMVCNKQLSTGEELYVIDENKFVCKDDYLSSSSLKEGSLNSGRAPPTLPALLRGPGSPGPPAMPSLVLSTLPPVRLLCPLRARHCRSPTRPFRARPGVGGLGKRTELPVGPAGYPNICPSPIPEPFPVATSPSLELRNSPLRLS